MSNSKITDFPEAGALDGTEKLYLVQNSTDTNISVSNLTGFYGASDAYYFHGFAGDQINGDPKFYDKSGAQNHGSFGANLSNLNAWSNDFYVSTVNPTGGSTDSVIRLPALNFDYSAGEKLIVWWLGIITPEGADASWMGDGFGTSYPV